MLVLLPPPRLDLDIGMWPRASHRPNHRPPDLANQIAAGEVVERPASVVKELVENALDAGAPRIAIAVELGGKKLIRVEDDGEGMDAGGRAAGDRAARDEQDRARRRSRRHRTLGFRGEALPSIASVSHFTLRTRARGRAERHRDQGQRRRRSRRSARSARPKARASRSRTSSTTCRRGGSSSSPTPRRRRRFRGWRRSWRSAIRRSASPSSSGGRSLLQCPPAASLRERFFQLFGERADLVEVRKDAAGLRIEGYVAALGDQGPTRGAQNVFVNRRIVKDRTIAHAIIEAYSVATIKERSPEVHLFLTHRARSRGRQRPPDEGGSALPRAGRSCMRCCAARSATRWAGHGAGTAVPPRVRRRRAGRADDDDDSRRPRRRDASAIAGCRASAIPAEFADRRFQLRIRPDQAICTSPHPRSGR